MMEFNWQLLNNHEHTKVAKFAANLNSSHVLARVLLNRGIEDIESARDFFITKLEDLHDPFLMAGMGDAVNRVETALQKGEKILIYGDYDVDGTTATSMLFLFFKGLGHPVCFYVPDRISEGYGLSEKGIHTANDLGCQLVISVDCGITATKEVALANTLGLDVIVCDHHEPGTEMPAAVAILNPKRRECEYPFKELAGVGVAFKLLQALHCKLELSESDLLRYLDLVAIGSAADIVPLVEENRILVKIGLKQLMTTHNTGLRALMEATNLMDRTVGVGQVVFVMAPRINAVGRMGDAGRAVRLLTCDNEKEARETAAVLETENRIRKEIDEATFAEALDIIEADFDPDNERILVLSHEGWHPGVIGIVASRIVEKYFRPTVMIATKNGVGKGSARSIPGFDIYRALHACQGLMTNFGGHKYAAGLTIETDKIPTLRDKLAEVAAASLSDEMLKPKIRIDAEIRLRDLDRNLLKMLDKMAPFGPQNMRPVFLTRNLQVVGTPRIVGKNHLKFKVRQDGLVMDVIGFNLGELLYRISSGEGGVELVYSIEENEFRGKIYLQLRIKDLH